MEVSYFYPKRFGLLILILFYGTHTTLTIEIDKFVAIITYTIVLTNKVISRIIVVVLKPSMLMVSCQ